MVGTAQFPVVLAGILKTGISTHGLFPEKCHLALVIGSDGRLPFICRYPKTPARINHAGPEKFPVR